MISVALCSYNGEKYIEEQINSILEQTVQVDEIVICDDGSKDKTIEVVSQVKRSSTSKTVIRTYVNEINLGVTKNFEKALSLCKGDIIFLSDQDDIWEKDKVEIMLKAFNNFDDCQLIFTDARLVDANGTELGVDLWDLTVPPRKENFGIRDFLGLRFVTGATVALRKELLEHTIPIPECWIHDAWLASNAAVYGGVRSVDRRLIKYRQHEKNVIGAKKRGFTDQIRYTKAHLTDSIKFRTTMKNRVLTLYENCKKDLLAEDIVTIKKCIVFWEESENLSKLRKLQGIEIILKNLLEGNYKKYNNGVYGAGVDFAILTVRKRIGELG